MENDMETGFLEESVRILNCEDLNNCQCGFHTVQGSI